MKIGVVCSSGGGVIKSIIDLLGKKSLFYESISIVTDRKSNLEDYCALNNIMHCRFSCDLNQEFSKKASDWFTKQNINIVFLFFSRLITADLYHKFPTFNFHPSLLPLYPGFGALDRAIVDKVRLFGATVHGVDGSVDMGPIVGQIVNPVCSNEKKYLNMISYMQKFFLFLVMLELLYEKKIDIENYCVAKEVKKSFNANPLLTHPVLVAAMRAVEKEKGVCIF